MKTVCKSQIKPLVCYRYFDNVFAVFPSKNNVDGFHTALGGMHTCIAFTVEDETSRKLYFLDIRIIRNTEQSTVNRKENFSPN